MKKMVIRLVLSGMLVDCFVNAFANAEDIIQPPVSQEQSSGITAFIDQNKSKIEGSLLWGFDEKARIFAGIPVRYWGDYREGRKRDYAKISLGAAWTKELNGWGKPKLSIPLAFDALEAGKEVWGFANGFTRRDDWTNNWRLWTSVSFLPPTDMPLHKSSWTIGKTMAVGVGIEARLGAGK